MVSFALRKSRFSLIFLFLLLSSFTPDFSKPENAKEQIQGKVGSYSLWIDPTKWKMVKDYSKGNEDDFVFSLEELVVYGNLYAKRISATEDLEDFREQFLDRIDKHSDDISVIKEENRNVNGAQMLYLQLLTPIGGYEVINDVYLYVGKESAIALSVICPKEFYSKYEKEILEFLNGLSVTK